MNPICIAPILFFALDPQGFGRGGHFRLEESKDDFGVRSHGIIETLADGRTKFYPLPQSTPQEFMRLRPEFLRMGNSFDPDRYDRQEVIGPHQVEGAMLWFGNGYYDSEGSLGVGAFGYFDTSTRRYTLFSPPEVAPCEVSAILVEPDRVWMGLDHFVEDISTVPGGLVEWDRTSHRVRKYPLEFVVQSIRAQGDALRLEALSGYAIFRHGEVHRFLKNGAPVTKFPAPPTKN